LFKILKFLIFKIKNFYEFTNKIKKGKKGIGRSALPQVWGRADLPQALFGGLPSAIGLDFWFFYVIYYLQLLCK